MTRIDLLTEASHAEIDHEGIPGVGGGGGGGPEELAYVELTSPVAPTASGGSPNTEGNTNAVVSAGSLAFDGDTTVDIEFHVPSFRSQASQTISLWLFDGTTSLGRIAFNSGSGFHTPCYVRRRLKPSNGSHTYQVRATVNGGEGQISAGSGGPNNDSVMPGYIRITTVPDPVS